MNSFNGFSQVTIYGPVEKYAFQAVDKHLVEAWTCWGEGDDVICAMGYRVLLAEARKRATLADNIDQYGLKRWLRAAQWEAPGYDALLPPSCERIMDVALGLNDERNADRRVLIHRSWPTDLEHLDMSLARARATLLDSWTVTVASNQETERTSFGLSWEDVRLLLGLGMLAPLQDIIAPGWRQERLGITRYMMAVAEHVNRYGYTGTAMKRPTWVDKAFAELEEC